MASSTADTSSMSFGSASSLAETFTASSRAGRRSVRHAATCALAISSTFRLMRAMSEVPSARGMNSDGGRRPSSGCCQRTNASTFTTTLSSARTIGW